MPETTPAPVNPPFDTAGQTPPEIDGAGLLSFFHAIDDLAIVASLDGCLLFVNDAVVRKLGRQRDELLALRVLDLHPPDLREEAERIFARVLRGEQSVCPLPMATKKGDLLPVETRAWPGKWEGHDCLFSLSKDLSAEEEARQRFEHLFRHNPMPMAINELPGRTFSDVNDAWLASLGYSKSDVLGKTSGDLDLFPDLEAMARTVELLLETGSIRDVELVVRTREGALLNGLFTGEILKSHGRDSTV